MTPSCKWPILLQLRSKAQRIGSRRVDDIAQSITRIRELFLRKSEELTSSITGCPKSSFLYFISLYFRNIGLGKQIILTKVMSFNIIHYFHTCCAIFWLEYSICLLPRQRCACASIFSSHTFFVFHSPNRSNSFLVFLWISRKINPLTQKRSAAWEHKPVYFNLLAYLL